MAGSKADYLENEILDHVLGGGDYSRPATVYVHLYTAAPSDSGGGTEVSTSDWSNYAAAEVTNNATNWPAASSGSKSNGTDVDFGTATIVTPVTVVAFAIKDGTNFLYWGDLSSSKVVTDGEAVKFPAGDMTISED